MLRSLWFLLCLLAAPVYGQFYVTTTPLHDSCQRFFPVEAARVLAWCVNQKGGRITKITWQVDSALFGASEWKISFLDAGDKVLHAAVVKYEDAGLRTGAAWYREIARTLASALPPLGISPDMGADSARFWRASEAAGDSRMSTVARTLRWLEDNDVTTAGHAAQLAGFLTHAVLPSMSGMVTLDAMLMARGAAWLCVAEQAAGRTADAEWCPLLFMAGREQQAAQVWPKDAQHGPEAPLALQWWHQVLTKPLAKDAFIFAGDSARITLALPFLARFARIEQSCGDSLLQILGHRGGEDAMRHLHDYGPLLVDTAGVGGGHFAAMAPTHARKEWLSTLQLAAGAGDPGLLNVVDAAIESVEDSDVDPSLSGLAATASLLRDGVAGAGDITPVAAVTLGDLLVFGHDNTLLQMVARHHHVSRNWGVTERAREILRVVGPCIPHFDVTQAGTKSKQPGIRPERYEMFDWFGIQRWAVPGYNQALDKEPLEHAARLWLRHCWAQEGVLWRLNAGLQPRSRMQPLLDRLEAEGGEECIKTLERLLRVAEPLKNRYLNDPEWQARIEKLTPNNITGRLSRTTSDRELHENPLALAQQMERDYWRIPGGGNEDTIFLLYLEAGALDAARRFYDQAHEVNTEDVGFSNRMANRRWMLAFMEGNKEDMEKHRFDASTFSHADIMKNFMQELAKGDNDRALAHLNAGIARYESETPPERAMFKRMRDFMPLLPALADARHPRHGEALCYFHRDEDWPSVQWILIQHCKLPLPEAEKFLGGEMTNPERLGLIAALRGDRQLFDSSMEQMQVPAGNASAKVKVGTMARVVTLYLRAKLHRIQPPEDQPDLRPTDAVPLHELTLRGLKNSR
ncbi:MAG: hypothetical protein ACO1TE_04150 [Prosthecobacter sp.]